MVKEGTGLGDQSWLHEGQGHLRPTWADTPHERTMVKRSDREGPSHTNMLNGLFTDMVMDQVLTDVTAAATDQSKSDGAELVALAKKTRPKEDADTPACGTEDTKKDDDDDLDFIRARRRKKFMEEKRKQEQYKQKGHGQYEIVAEDEFLTKVTASERVVCHFFHRDFERCKIMDHHLKRLAPKFVSTKFMGIDSEKAPFFVDKLAIKTLPTVVLFKDGVAVHKILGFHDIGGSDEFPTVHLAKVICAYDAIEGDVDTDTEFD